MPVVVEISEGVMVEFDLQSGEAGVSGAIEHILNIIAVIVDKGGELEAQRVS